MPRASAAASASTRSLQPSRVADRAEPRPAPCGEQEGLANRLGLAGRRARADDERRVRAVRDAGEAADGVERRLDQLERGLARRRDEHGVGAAEVALGPERQTMAEANERLAAERQVELGDPEAVQARDDRQHAAGLGRELGADAVPGEAGDGVAPAHDAGSIRWFCSRARALLF